MIKLEENKGISRYLILMMAILAGVSVANLYYNQPLLELIRMDFSVTEVQANLISVITQIGYATGLFLIIPMGDLYSYTATNKIKNKKSSLLSYVFFSV